MGIEERHLPMVHDDVALGGFGVTRPIPGGYADAEMSLLQTFVNQAAVAVENARLLRRDRGAQPRARRVARRADRDQCDPRAISANPGNLRKVFDGIVTLAARLCDADGAGVEHPGGGRSRADGHEPHGRPTNWVGRYRTTIPAGFDLSVTRFFDDLFRPRSEMKLPQHAWPSLASSTKPSTGGSI